MESEHKSQYVINSSNKYQQNAKEICNQCMCLCVCCVEAGQVCDMLFSSMQAGFRTEVEVQTKQQNCSVVHTVVAPEHAVEHADLELQFLIQNMFQ